MTCSQIVEEFGNELQHGFGTFFVGAGISAASGLPDWAKLLRRKVKSDLSLDLETTDDLVQMTQFLLNRDLGNRGPIVQHFKKMLSKPLAPNANHRALTMSKVSTIWTTNFDTLLEQAFRENFAIDVKSSDDSISRTVLQHQVEIIKMHGSIDSSKPEELVFASADYEDFASNRPATSQRLRMDLLNKSFLFIGYSYRDPNIRNVIVEARRLASNATRPHFLITLEETGVREKQLQDLWCQDLRRNGIRCAMIKKYSELTTTLEALSRRSRGRSVSVTGSHVSTGQPLAQALGRFMAEEKDTIVIDGQSTGPSRQFVTAFTERAAIHKIDIGGRLRIFPNPYANTPAFESNKDLLPVLEQWRAPLMRDTHILVAFDGGMGTSTEVELAIRCGCTIVPVPISAKGTARELMKRSEITARLPPEYIRVCKTTTPTQAQLFACLKQILESAS